MQKGNHMNLTKPGSKGLSAYQIKLIALVFMTIDHVGAYAFEIPIVAGHDTTLRILGRIAAPLFLYMLTESVRYTHSKTGLLLRLYGFAVLTGLLTTGMNCFLGDVLGVYRQSNILFSYFYTALYIVLLEEAGKAVRNHNWRRLLLSVAGILSTGLVHLLCRGFNTLSGISALGRDLFDSFVQSPWLTEYSPLFILMGVLIYFAAAKWAKIAVFLAFCGISRFVWLQTGVFAEFLGYPQYWMVLAVPFMLLYNGTRGEQKHTLLFYLYYPLHRYLIIAVCWLLTA